LTARPTRLASRLAATVAAAAALLPGLAGAQQWGFNYGGSARTEYTDNYQLRPINTFSATTLTVSPFVTGFRRTETSQLNLLAGIGYNYVLASGGGDNTDYWSGRLNLNGSTVVERSNYGFNVGVSRDQTIRTEAIQTGIVFGTPSTRTAVTAGANYGYQLTERWNAGANASVFSNSFGNVQGTTANTGLNDNTGYGFGGNLGYAWSNRTQVTLAANYSHFASDITDSDSISTTLAATHQYSDRLTVSGYGGYFWSKIKSTQNFVVCPTTPIFCQLGFVPFVPVALGTERDSTGTLFGGSVNYRITEKTSFNFNASQNLTPSGTGVVTKATAMTAGLSHAFSERMRGGLSAGWTRSTVPGFDNNVNQRSTFYSYGANVSYDLAERWLLDVGVRRQETDNRGVSANGNVIFVSIAYNWPGQSFSDWTGGFGGFPVPAAAPTAGIPPAVVPGQPMGAPVPVPRAAEERPATDSNQ
jgi:hypothetical protein